MSTQINVSNSVNLAERLKFAKEADALARQNSFIDYRSRRARNTLRRQDAELVNFGVYVGNDDLATNPRAWEGISFGIVEGFVKKMLYDGYAVSSVNNQLSTIKTYTKLAMKAGKITTQEQAMIRTVNRYSHAEGKQIDEKREAA